MKTIPMDPAPSNVELAREKVDFQTADLAFHEPFCVDGLPTKRTGLCPVVLERGHRTR